MVDNSSYIHIEYWMTKLELSNPQLIIYAIIHGFSRDGNYYKGSQMYFRKWTGKAKSTVIEAINDLKKKGLIVVKKVSGKGKLYNIYYSTESRKSENEKLINKPADKSERSENQTGPEIGPPKSENQTSQVRKSDLSGPKSGHNNIAILNTYAVDSTSHYDTLEDEFSDSAVTARISSKIIDKFHSLDTFDKQLIPEIEKAILDSRMPNSLIECYLDFAYEKTLSKNPSSITGLFRKIAAAPDVVQDFLLKQPKTKKLEMIICPVCKKETVKGREFCDNCSFSQSDFENERNVILAIATNRLSEEKRLALNEELDQHYQTFDLRAFRNPEKIQEHKRRTASIYAKYGIRYEVA